MKTDKDLEKILKDKTSGSSEVLFKLNNYFKDIIGEPKKFKFTIQIVKKELSHFSSVDNYVKSLETIYSTKSHQEIEDFLNTYYKIQLSKYQKLYKNSKPFLINAKTILTISNSKTLAEFFKIWKKENRRLKVIVCESRPKYEGRIFARTLLHENIKVELITDFMISLFIPKVDAVILGADSILKNGNVINKVGSLTAALLCKQLSKPFYVLTTKEKFTNRKTLRQNEQLKSEVWNYQNKNLTIKNIYFEEVPKKLITKIITD